MSKEFKDKQEENSSKVYELIRDLTLKAKKEIEEEKAVREETHEEILNYIEETCNKLTENWSDHHYYQCLLLLSFVTSNSFLNCALFIGIGSNIFKIKSLSSQL